MNNSLFGQLGSFIERIDNINDRFETIEEIGRGTYGIVQKSRDLGTNENVAIKRILFLKNQESDFPHNTLREVLLLKELRHINIVELKKVIQVVHPEDCLYLVFEYCEYDLYALLDSKELGEKYIQSLMKQFIVVLQYCHVRKVIHRDLKPANLFVTRENVLKLGDFGLARKYKNSEKPNYSDKVITLWYRPPELLMGYKQYGAEIDIWSAGCILYEMVTYKPLFKAKNNEDISQLNEIFSICGRPPKEWVGHKGNNMSLFNRVKANIPENSVLEEHLKKEIPSEYSSLIDLLIQMLNLNPKERITAEDALNHKFFRDLGNSVDPFSLETLNIKENHQKKAAEMRKKEKPMPDKFANRSQDRLDNIHPDKPQPGPISL